MNELIHGHDHLQLAELPESPPRRRPKKQRRSPPAKMTMLAVQKTLAKTYPGQSAARRRRTAAAYMQCPTKVSASARSARERRTKRREHGSCSAWSRAQQSMPSQRALASAASATASVHWTQRRRKEDCTHSDQAWTWWWMDRSKPSKRSGPSYVLVPGRVQQRL